MSWRLDPKKLGVLVVDLQEKLLPVISGHERVLKKSRDALMIARLFQLPIFLTEQAPDKIGPTVPSIREIIPDVAPLPKNEFSAAAVLPADLPKNLIVLGVETHVCVRQTVYDLREKNRIVQVLVDAVGSRWDLDHSVALQEMHQDKVLLSTVETWAWELVGRADGDAFKQALSILK